MMEEIIKNLNFEIKMLKEISEGVGKLDSLNFSEKAIMNKTLDALRGSIRIVNSSVKSMIMDLSLASPLKPEVISPIKFEEVSMNIGGNIIQLTLEKGSKDRFLEELRISDESVKKMKAKKVSEPQLEQYVSSRVYLKMANGLFLPIAKKLASKEMFQKLSLNLKKANMNYLLEGYISYSILTTLISFMAGIFVFVLLLFLKVNITTPYLSVYSGDILSRIMQIFWIPVFLPVAVAMFMYWYPSSERDSLENKIDQELPFAVVNMSAISGSGVEPSVIFKIIAVGEEYPNLKKEFIKLVNQINLQGYDLITALNSCARNSPSKRLAELFSGIAVTISTGGDLSDFFEKRAATLINEYRLTREKFAKLAETSMDLYITVVIAAPMILLLVFVLLGITDFGPSIPPTMMTLILIATIAVVNVVFLSLMKIKQPVY